MKKNKHIYIVIAFAALAIAVIVSILFPEKCLQIRSVGILAACLIFWISEALPISISALFLIALLPFLGLMDYRSIMSNFGTNTALFIMASSGITVALSSSHIPQRITGTVLKAGGNHPKMLVMLVALIVALFSAFVSSLATCALFTSLISAALRASGIEPKQKNLGKDLMLVIPACAGIGGFMSPAGTPANILVMDMLEAKGHAITFLQWCFIGFPVGLIATILFAFSVILLFPPEEGLLNSTESATLLQRRDHTILAVVLMVIAGWFAGSFVPLLNTTVVALLGLGLLFILPENILDMEKFSHGVNWDLVLAMGSVSILMTSISDTGLLSEIVSVLLKNVTGLPVLLLLVVVSVIVCAMRSFIPTTTAVIALFAPMLMAVAELTGIHVMVFLLIVSFWAAAALLLVYTEPIYLIAYKEGYFSEKDLFRAGIIPSLIMAIISSVLIYTLVHAMGL